MRGILSSKTRIRHEVFTEIARLAYSGRDLSALDELPYKIVPGEVASYRNSIFLERAVAGERLRVAMGMPLRSITEHSNVSEGVEESNINEKYYTPPLINIIKFACNACAENRVFVTDGCQGCLEHPCREVCPKKAVRIEKGSAVIEEDLCIKCGKCMDACQYHAIIRQERPCAKACGMNAIHSDQYGRAEIDYDKCVSCGMCLVNCPFSAIVDKGQIYQTIMALKSDVPVYAIIAPSIAGQFGPEMTSTKIRGAFRALGFTDVVEVAVGADLCAIEEAKDFLQEVPEKIPFMGTSCCPAWSSMVKKMYPEFTDCISMTLTPMVLTARLVKEKNPSCKIVFIGPCAAKKLEASRTSVRSYVDFVLTFEEVQGMFDAKDILFKDIPEGEPLRTASADGRGFAASGGVAAAVVRAVHRIDPEREVPVAQGNGLQECQKMMKLAKAGKYNGYLLEGMGCPGGCIAGAGTLQNVKKAGVFLNQTQKEAGFAECMDTDYKELLPKLKQFGSEID